MCVNVCLYTWFLFVWVNELFLLNFIGTNWKNLSCWFVFFLALATRGWSTKDLTSLQGYIFYPCTFAVCLTLNFGFQSHIFPFCCPYRLQVGCRCQSQHLSCWRSQRQQPPCSYSNKNIAVMKRILPRWQTIVGFLLKCHKFVLLFRDLYLRLQLILYLLLYC